MFQVWSKELDRSGVLTFAEIAKGLPEYKKREAGTSIGFLCPIDRIPLDIKPDYISLEELKKQSPLRLLSPFEFKSEKIDLCEAAVREICELQQDLKLTIHLHIADSLENINQVKRETYYLWLWISQYRNQKERDLISVEVMLGMALEAHRDQQQRAKIFNKVLSLLKLNEIAEVYVAEETTQARALSDVLLTDHRTDKKGMVRFFEASIPVGHKGPVSSMKFRNCLERKDLSIVLCNLWGEYKELVFEQDMHFLVHDIETLDEIRGRLSESNFNWNFNHISRNPFGIREIEKGTHGEKPALFSLFNVRIPKHRTVTVNGIYHEGGYKLLFTSLKERGKTEAFQKILETTFEGCSLFD